ncbi:ABC transporter efflux protein, DrrB family [Amycolatopsis tolypomycina]|uniref:Transport permease protein n=1 Tax=Amycolatopsis tolypomycina TaxID=208445 RepID=A0A1H4VQ59_9PSEU|nr:ABC transporter permease [Amycolatopsis tolypomycina]SEC82708.1 ABC transporter efflux protein, DrrB family [Amycolatopsis tolypomycina]
MRWAIEDGWTLTQRYLAQLARRPARLVGVVAFPILMVLIFAYLLGGGMSVPGGGSYREFLMPGMFAMTMAFGLSGTMIAVVDDTGKGVTDRFRSLPMAPSAVFTGRVAADLVNATLALAVLVGCGLAVGWRPHGSAGETLAALGLLLLLRTALVWIGIYLGLLTSDPSMVTLTQTLEFPFGFLSGAFVATSTMPVWLGTVAEWNPLSSTVTAARVLFGNPGAAGTSWVSAHAVPMAVVWPLVLLAVFVPLSVRRYGRLGN